MTLDEYTDTPIIYNMHTAWTIQQEQQILICSYSIS